MLVPPHFLVSTAFKKMRWKDEFRKWLPKLPNTTVLYRATTPLLCLRPFYIPPTSDVGQCGGGCAVRGLLIPFSFPSLAVHKGHTLG